MIIKKVGKKYSWNIDKSSMIYFNECIPLCFYNGKYEQTLIIRFNQTLKYDKKNKYFEIIQEDR